MGLHLHIVRWLCAEHVRGYTPSHLSPPPPLSHALFVIRNQHPVLFSKRFIRVLLSVCRSLLTSSILCEQLAKCIENFAHSLGLRVSCFGFLGSTS